MSERIPYLPKNPITPPPALQPPRGVYTSSAEPGLYGTGVLPFGRYVVNDIYLQQVLAMQAAQADRTRDWPGKLITAEAAPVPIKQEIAPPKEKEIAPIATARPRAVTRE
jgi:hypothetical protein